MSLPITEESCFTCGRTASELKKQGETLKTCSSCRFAKYCGRNCQIVAYHDHHKASCNLHKKARVDAERIENKLKSNGIDLKTYYDESFLLLEKQHLKYVKENSMTSQSSQPLKSYLHSENLDHLACLSFESYLQLYEIALRARNRQGVQIVLNGMIEFLGINRPRHFRMRYWIPVLFLDLGQYQKCYDYIKFWLSKAYEDSSMTIQTREWHLTMSDPIKGDSSITKFTLENEDPKENIFKALKIFKQKQQPYFLEVNFYICLMIIKFHVFSVKEKEVLEKQVFEILEYFEKFYPNMVKSIIDCEPDERIETPKYSMMNKALPPMLKAGIEEELNASNYYLRFHLERDEQAKDFIKVILDKVMLEHEGRSIKSWRKKKGGLGSSVLFKGGKLSPNDLMEAEMNQVLSQ